MKKILNTMVRLLSPLLIATSIFATGNVMKMNAFAATVGPDSDVFLDKSQIISNMDTFNSAYNLNGGKALKVKFGKRNEQNNWYIAGAEKYNNTDSLVLYFAGDNSGAYTSMAFGTSDQKTGGAPDYAKSTLWKRLNSDSSEFADSFGKKYLFSDNQINKIVPVNLKYSNGSEQDLPDNYLYVPRYKSSAAVVGSTDQFRIGKDYVSNTGAWTRDMANYNGQQRLYKVYREGTTVTYTEGTMTSNYLVIPAFNLNISDLLFAYGGETVPENNPSVVTPGTMNLYFDGSSKINSTLTVSKDKIKVDLKDLPSSVGLMIVGKDGANNYQYYSNIEASMELNTSDVAHIDDFTNCKVWLSCMDADNTYYAKVAVASTNPTPTDPTPTDPTPTDPTPTDPTPSNPDPTTPTPEDNNTNPFAEDFSPAMIEEPVVYADSNVDPTTLNCKFYHQNGKSYWYENGIRQGTYDDPKGVMGDGTIRGREICDMESVAWYWCDSVYNGAKAVNKEVWIPYVYNGENKWSETEIKQNAAASGSMAVQVERAIKSGTGKWVRYNANGKMYKEWYKVTAAEAQYYPDQVGNIYYFDLITGLMAHGDTLIDGVWYHFDEVTGVLQR